MTDTPRRWVSVPEAAKLLGISERQTYRLAKNGDIRRKKERGRIWVEVSDYGSEKGEKSDQNDEIVRLEQENADLKNERDYLRQALAISLTTQQKLVEAGEQKTEEPTPAKGDKPPPDNDQDRRRWSWRHWPWSQK